MQPQAAYDSLKLINTSDLSRYNKAYYNLLEVIAKDKTYFKFTSDSLINKAVVKLSGYKNEQAIHYARSLLYQAIVRYRMGITDSTAYEPIKNAIDFLETKQINNTLILFFCYEYLGLIHYDNNNLNISIGYFKQAIEQAKILGSNKYLFDAYVEIIWAYMAMEKFSIAKQNIDTLTNFKDLSELQAVSINHILSSYYEYSNETKKAMEINIRLLSAEKTNRGNVSVLYRKISKNYNALNKLDSALYFAEKAEECIQDSSYYLNYLYYKNIAEISAHLKLWQKSAGAYQQAYQLREKAANKEMDMQILEIEKKYDLVEAENKALQYQNRTIWIGFISMTIIILLITLIVIYRQHSIRAVMRTKISDQQNKLLLREKIMMERSLIEKEFILPLFQQVSQQNADIKDFLSDLLTNPYLSRNAQLSHRINESLQDFTTASDIQPNSLLTDEKFTELTGIKSDNCKLLNENEKLLLVFVSLHLDNKQIAILFNTSKSSIRGRRSRLRSKFEQYNIDKNNIDI